MLLPVRPKCMQPPTDGAYIFEYPEMLKHEKLQMESFWLPSEPKIENEVHEILTGLEPSEYHGVITVLKLFTEYERRVGGDYWSGRFKRMFPRPEFERVAIVNAMTEINIHAPFYNQINELLRLDTIEFYNSYKNVKSMADRMEFIGKLITSKNDMLSLAAFTMVEGAVLYSNFAFLKHFQAKGKNKIKRIVSGIDFSVRDENCFSESTDVLTDKGFVNIKDVTLDTVVVCYDTERPSIYKMFKPTNLVQSKTDVSFVFKGENYEQCVTPQHRMVCVEGVYTATEIYDKEMSLGYISTNVSRYIDTTKKKSNVSITNTDETKYTFGDIETKVKTDSKVFAAFYKEVRDVTITKHQHEPKTFYCLTVPTGAFVVRYNGKESVTGNCHSLAGAHAFRIAMKEIQEDKLATQEEVVELINQIYEAAHAIAKHEDAIIDEINAKGEQRGCSSVDMKGFIRSRLNLCLENLGLAKLFSDTECENTINEWFYNGITMPTIHDFFAAVGSQYHRNWSEAAFTVPKGRYKFVG